MSASKGDLAAPPAELVDFIYRDLNRLHSFYAQLFRGRLLAYDSGTGTKTQKSVKIAGNAGVAAGSAETTSGSEKFYKETFDPHDFALVEAIVRLQEANLVAADAELAQHGELILVQGSVVFIDRHVLKFGKIGIQAAIAEEQSKPRKSQNASSLATMGALVKTIDEIELPSLFVLESGNASYGGAIKESGLEEPISSYYYRYGGRALPEIYLLGLKELPVTPRAHSGDGLFATLGEGLNLIQGLGLPPEAVRVTPIALFRKVTAAIPPELFEDEWKTEAIT